MTNTGYKTDDRVERWAPEGGRSYKGKVVATDLAEPTRIFIRWDDGTYLWHRPEEIWHSDEPAPTRYSLDTLEQLCFSAGVKTIQFEYSETPPHRRQIVYLMMAGGGELKSLQELADYLKSIEESDACA